MYSFVLYRIKTNIVWGSRDCQSSLLTTVQQYKKKHKPVYIETTNCYWLGSDHSLQGLCCTIFLLTLSFYSVLKGMCHNIFYLYFFHDSNPSGPLIKRLKHFRILFRIRRDIWIFKKLHGVHHTVDSDSTVCIKSQDPRCASHRGVWLHDVQCASWPRVSNLLSVCFDPKFYNSYFSLMP